MRRLLHTNIDRAGDASKLLRQRSGDLVIGRQVAAENLNIERRRQSEVNRLRYDVRRQEIELSAREFLVQIEPQLPHVICGRLMVLLQCDKNVGIGRSSGAGVVVAQINSGVRNADIVDDALKFLRRDPLSDDGFYLIDQLGRFFDARSGKCTHV